MFAICRLTERIQQKFFNLALISLTGRKEFYCRQIATLSVVRNLR